MNCLDPASVRRLQEHIKEFDIAKLYEMSSGERNALFSKYLKDDEAYYVVQEFDAAIKSDQEAALGEWVLKTFRGKQEDAGDEVMKDARKRKDPLTSAQLEDYVTESLGITVTGEELEKITKLSEELQDLALDEEFGSPTKAYWVKREEMINYMQSLTPTHNLKVATSLIGRGMMLFSPKSAVTNIVGNTALAITESLARRLSGGQAFGLNGDYALKWFKHNQAVFQASGYDMSRMRAIIDDQKRLGEGITSAQGPGAIRKVGRVVEEIVFKQLMGAPDVAFSSAHFVDSVNLSSTKMAYNEGLKGSEAQERAKEIMVDAFAVEPVTKEGQLTRERAIYDAEVATYTDANQISEFSLKLRGAINSLYPDLALGELMMPFVKTPANVVVRTAEASGIKAPLDLIRLAQGIKSGDAKEIKAATHDLFKGGLGVTAALILVSAIEPEDYIGDYDFLSQSERELVEAEGAAYNSVKIGGSWYSLDYWGPIAAPLVGMMTAKKYGKGLPDTLFRYAQGVTQQMLKLPGLGEFWDGMRESNEFADPKKTDLEQFANDMAGGLVEFAASRAIPAVLSDAAKMLDENERDIEYGTAKGAVQSLKRKIPGMSQGLESKYSIFGEPIKTQPGWAQLAFGARVKKGTGNEITNELNRLSAGNMLPTLTDIRRTSAPIRRAVEKHGQRKVNEAFKIFGESWRNLILNESDGINSKKYKELDIEDQRKKWGDWKTVALNKMKLQLR